MGLAINAVTGTRLWLLSFSSWNDFDFVVCPFVLCGCGSDHSAAVVQRFVHFSTHPQVMQQHCQLSCGGHDGPLLGVSSAPLGQLQTPAPEIAVHTERSQDMLR